LFLRNLGDGSDVVTKEMYLFEDKSQQLVALRPENTAGVVRAFISNRLTASTSQPFNVFYHGPMFRHERCVSFP
jgi:histidyl-tRNA synthetase